MNKEHKPTIIGNLDLNKYPKKLNLGCGLKAFKGFTNIDYFDNEVVDRVVDLNKHKWDFKDDEFDLLYSDNTLEHLKNDIMEIVDEMVRITKDKGRIITIVPHYTTGGSHSEFHYKQFWYRSFEYRFGSGSFSLENQKFKPLKLIRRKLIFNKHPVLFYNYLIEPIMNFWLMPFLYENTFLQYLFPAQDIYFEFEVQK